jgi:hypothetical protein
MPYLLKIKDDRLHPPLMTQISSIGLSDLSVLTKAIQIECYLAFLTRFLKVSCPLLKIESIHNKDLWPMLTLGSGACKYTPSIRHSLSLRTYKWGAVSRRIVISNALCEH